MSIQNFHLDDFKTYQKNNPYMNYNHIEIVSAGMDSSTVKVDLQPESMNLNGYVHGGLLYSLADCVTGITARMDGRNYVTQSAHINFLSNVTGGSIFCTSEVIRRGHRVIVQHVKIRDEKDHLLADGSVDMMCITK